MFYCKPLRKVYSRFEDLSNSTYWLYAEVVEVMEAKGTVDNPPDGALDAFDKALGPPVVEVAEELVVNEVKVYHFMY